MKKKPGFLATDDLRTTTGFTGPANFLRGQCWALLAAATVFAGGVFSSSADQFTVAPPAVADITNGSAENSGQVSSAATNVAAPGSTNFFQALDDSYRLAKGDRLSFKIVEDNEDSKPLQVTDSGDIDFPYIGRFPVVGMTCKQLAADLKLQFEKEYYFHATVVVAVDFKARSQGKVYLVGPVRSPGPQEIPSDEEFTLSKAILRAGGFTDFADQHHVRVTRKDPGQGAGSNKIYTVDVGKVMSKSKTDLDLVLEPGDFIFIPEKTIRF